MATQTIHLHGTTTTLTTNENGATLDVIGPGTLDITHDANNATIKSSQGAIIDIGHDFNGGSVDLNNSVVALHHNANKGEFHFGTGVSTVEIFHSFNNTTYTHLNAGDRIEVPTQFNSYDLSGHTLSLIENGHTVAHLDVTLANGAPSTFTIGHDVTTGLDFLQVACFAAGTRILTMHGEVAVEDLRPTDLVVTLSGKGSPVKSVAWVGWRDIDLQTHPQPDLVRPIRIRAGAFDALVPRRDLVVSPDHAVLVDGVLISAGKLVNGVSVVQDMAVSKVRYFHVELEQHDVLLAEGMPAESFLDTGNRDQFVNAAHIVALHANFAAKRMQTDACLPFVESGTALAAARRRLIERIRSQGYTVGHDPELVLFVNGRPVSPAVVDGLRYCFDLHEKPQEIFLASRTFAPAGVSADNEDCRRLGVCLSQIAVTPAGGLTQEIAISDPELTSGFYEVESDGVGKWRWTDGHAQLAPAWFKSEEVRLELCLAWPGSYWTEPSRYDQPRRIAS